jgi:hypothetical protein
MILSYVLLIGKHWPLQEPIDMGEKVPNIRKLQTVFQRSLLIRGVSNPDYLPFSGEVASTAASALRSR